MSTSATWHVSDSWSHAGRHRLKEVEERQGIDAFVLGNRRSLAPSGSEQGGQETKSEQQSGELENGTSFQTPGGERREPDEKPLMGKLDEMEPEELYEPLANDAARVSGKRHEGAWKRRTMGDGRNSKGDEHDSSEKECHGKGLEEALGSQMLQHFQSETTRLQMQNDMLVKELQRMREERSQQPTLAVPPSWHGNVRGPTPPPRVSPATNGTQTWLSPETFRCTPNGTRVPSGPPPPDPPPFPKWPPEFAHYDKVEEPPRKFRGVMGDGGFRLSQGVCSPQDARHFWLEQEVASLREKLESEAMRSRSLHGSYWSRPFQTEAQKVRHDQESVAYMRSHAEPGLMDPKREQRSHGDVFQRDRADVACVHGALSLSSCAGPGQAHGDECGHALSGPEQAHGDLYRHTQSGPVQALGDRFLQACAGPEQALGERCLPDRAHDAAMRELGEVYQQDRAGDQCPIGGALHQSRAQRHEREVVEDGDLKSIPIQLPLLPSPDGRDASLEAGDWLIQLEPLIGDLSKNAAGWWRKIMDATTSTYSCWLHADPLARLKIVAPENGTLSSGFERLDQRVTSLLLQSVPKAIKDEIIATRELSTTAILFRVMRTFQPGGLLEKSRLLEDLTTITTVKTSQDVVAALRLWKRKASRASELCAQLPDPLLLIRTLDGIAKPVVDSSPQASFRIATFRMNYSLDIRPSLANVWLFYDLLLAEAEVAVHSSTTTSMTEAKTSTKAAVKAMQSPTTSKTTTQASMWPCKFWLSEGGCRQGQRCRWPHPWEGVADRTSRCTNCSSLQHLQADCPFKTQVKSPVGGEGDSKEDVGGGVKSDKGGGKGKGKNKGKSKNDSNQKGATKDSSQGKKEDSINRTTTAGAEDEVKGKAESTATSTGGGVGGDKKAEGGGNGTTELLQEATKLLKSLHLPNVKMIKLQEIGDPMKSPSDLMLLDSGATHALRRASSWSEWNDATTTVVALAKGTTSSLRLKSGTETLLSTPDDDSFGNGILPMGALTKLGYEITWSGGDCKMMGTKGDKVEVTVINGCPMVPRQLGMELMEHMENNSRVTKARSALVRTIVQHPELMEGLSDLDAATLLQVMLKKEFPDLPDTICQKVAPSAVKIDTEQLPWNRGLRRRMMRARRVILHLYSGPDQKTWQVLQDSDTEL
ncbi:unnamed protein product [Cladocopium goreaui]|uniref:Retrovirus-related Pol polyprotein from transposon TNT 1-94 n=1 Tax=Cladocopium goreaui TaxID=2562237 RepID=A0A9P1DB84_9DINO|nr:unnamed protein product [Cladocopium goreaui]